MKGIIYFMLVIFFLFGCEQRGPIWSVKNVAFKSEDNTLLKGTLYSSNNEGPGIVLIHECSEGSDRNSWESIGELLAAQGFHVLAFDLRGYGESLGEWPEFNSMSEFIEVCRSTISKDLIAGCKFLQNQKLVDKTRMGLAGASCGVFMSIDYASLKEEIKSMVLISGPFDQIAEERLANLVDVPALIIASEDDQRAFEAMKRAFKTTKNPNSVFIQLKGNNHGTKMLNRQFNLEQEIVEWFKMWLR